MCSLLDISTSRLISMIGKVSPCPSIGGEQQFAIKGYYDPLWVACNSSTIESVLQKCGSLGKQWE